MRGAENPGVGVAACVIWYEARLKRAKWRAALHFCPRFQTLWI